MPKLKQKDLTHIDDLFSYLSINTRRKTVWPNDIVNGGNYFNDANNIKHMIIGMVQCPN